MRWLKEPLVAFFALAALIFLVAGPGEDPGVVRVSRSQVAAAQTSRLGRTPTERELADAIRRQAEHLALVREARRLGMDEADPIVERRLVQRMELLAEDLATLDPPSDETLQAYLTEHIARFVPGERRTVRHVFVPPDSGLDAQTLLQALQGGADPAKTGRAFVAGHRFVRRTEVELGQTLGATVAAGAFASPEGRWTGPHASPFGAHLVRVEAVVPPTTPKLERVRTKVLAAWEADARERARTEARRRARDAYEVEVVE